MYGDITKEEKRKGQKYKKVNINLPKLGLLLYMFLVFLENIKSKNWKQIWKTKMKMNFFAPRGRKTRRYKKYQKWKFPDWRSTYLSIGVTFRHSVTNRSRVSADLSCNPVACNPAFDITARKTRFPKALLTMWNNALALWTTTGSSVSNLDCRLASCFSGGTWISKGNTMYQFRISFFWSGYFGNAFPAPISVWL